MHLKLDKTLPEKTPLLESKFNQANHRTVGPHEMLKNII